MIHNKTFSAKNNCMYQKAGGDQGYLKKRVEKRTQKIQKDIKVV